MMIISKNSIKANELICLTEKFNLVLKFHPSAQQQINMSKSGVADAKSVNDHSITTCITILGTRKWSVDPLCPV